MSEPRTLVEHFFRHESARLLASLTRSFGIRHLECLEDAVQGALMRALASWSHRGIPPEPSAWLYRVAHNLALDALRRDLRWNSVRAALTARASDVAAPLPLQDEVGDDLLRLIFVCCDECIPPESQVALALKTLCGFSTEEIARALLTTEANIARRLGRAKERLRAQGINANNLASHQITSRLPSVLSVLYLLFNEGYSATRAESLIRVELCQEAVRLAYLLAKHPLTAGPQTAAFLALLLLHAARLETRVDSEGMLLLLEDQDRSLWDQQLIAEGFRWFSKAASGDRVTRFHAEAWIAAEHSRVTCFRETNWDAIVRAYDLLITLAPSPIHELNRAIALAERDGPTQGWDALQSIGGELLADRYHLWSAAVGEMARRLGRHAEARRHLEQALRLAGTDVEQRFLKKRLEMLGPLGEIPEGVP